MKKKSLWFVLSGTILSSFGFVPAYLNENVENSNFTSDDDVPLSGNHGFMKIGNGKIRDFEDTGGFVSTSLFRFRQIAL